MRYPISDNARELAITDFCFSARAEGVLSDRTGPRYLVYAPILPAPKPVAPPPVAPPAVAEAVPAPARRVAEWTLYALWGAAAAAAIWFLFVVPRSEGTAAPIRFLPSSSASFSASPPRNKAQ